MKQEERNGSSRRQYNAKSFSTHLWSTSEDFLRFDGRYFTVISGISNSSSERPHARLSRYVVYTKPTEQRADWSASSTPRHLSSFFPSTLAPIKDLGLVISVGR